MSDKVEITDEMVERAYKVYGSPAAHGSPNDPLDAHKGRMKRALDFVMNGPAPKPQALAEQDQINAGLAAIQDFISYDGSRGAYIRGENFQKALATAYPFMHALAPLPEVTDEAVTAAWHAANPMSARNFLNEDDLSDTRRALTAALPILLGRKNGEGVGGACAPEVEEWVWCVECQCSYGPGSSHAFDERKKVHKRTGPKDRRGHRSFSPVEVVSAMSVRGWNPGRSKDHRGRRAGD